MEYVNKNFSDYIFNTSIENVIFKECFLTNAIFQDISMNNIQFIDCVLKDIVLNNCHIISTKFINSSREIPRVSIINCIIKETYFYDVFLLVEKN